MTGKYVELMQFCIVVGLFGAVLVSTSAINIILIRNTYINGYGPSVGRASVMLSKLW